MINKILKNKEFFRYITGGIIITLSNIAVYTVLVMFGVKIRYANLVAMFFSKTLGYGINKYYVYRTKTQNLKETGKEATKYFSVRFLTGVLDYFLLVILVEFFNFHPFITKYFVTALVIVLNYILGKYFVFVSKKTLDS
ncbi:MAG: GtrA family protein [Alphaproteobacteria bacterium]|nr:GtrA family protein [Alphaproteobacteria bacterium]